MTSSVPAKPIRVAYVDHTALMSGGEIALFNLITHLDRTAVEPIVILFADGPLADRLRAARVETHVVPADDDVLNTRKDSLGASSALQVRAAIACVRQAWRVRRLLRQRGVQIVHTNSLKSDVIAGLAGRLARKWVIWHVRDRIEPDYLPPTVVRAFRLLCRWVPHHVVANSRSTLATLHLGDRRKRRQTVVYSGVVIHDGTPMPSAGYAYAVARQSVDVQSRPSSDAAFDARLVGRPIVGLIGRISRWKGQHVLIEAAAKLRGRGILARYRLIGSAMFGEDAYERELRDRVEALGVADLIEFSGFRDDIAAELSSLDIVVHTSITPEPFGQVVVEGMAAGKPVIAAGAGGVVEIIEHNVSGVLVPPGDAEALAHALAELLSDPIRAARLGAGGRARVEAAFTVERVARDVADLYRSLIAAAPQA